MNTNVVTFPLMPKLLGLRLPVKSPLIILGVFPDVASHAISTKLNTYVNPLGPLS